MIKLLLASVVFLFAPDGRAAGVVDMFKNDALKEMEGATGEEGVEIGKIVSEKYLNFSKVLRNNGDYESSDYFFKLSRVALLDKSKKPAMGRPEQVADLYFLFDCWNYFETKNKNLGEATICKNSFIKLYNLLKKNVGNTSKGNKRIASIEYSPGLTREEEVIFSEFMKKKSLDIFFDYDSYKLNPDGVAKIGLLLKYINGLKNDYRMVIVGHADRVGKPIYNNTIARRRANAVMNILVKNGVPRTLIKTQSYGSRFPKIITEKETRNKFNRRVEIIVDTEYKNQDFLPEPQT